MNEPLFYPYYGFLGREPEFELGVTVMTRGVKEILSKDTSFIVEIDDCFEKFIHRDMGFMSSKPGKLCAIKKGQEIMGAYKTSKESLYIVTSHDRAATIIMLFEDR